MFYSTYGVDIITMYQLADPRSTSKVGDIFGVKESCVLHVIGQFVV